MRYSCTNKMCFISGAQEWRHHEMMASWDDEDGSHGDWESLYIHCFVLIKHLVCFVVTCSMWYLSFGANCWHMCRAWVSNTINKFECFGCMWLLDWNVDFFLVCDCAKCL